MEKVALGLSGGVDSAVAAARLRGMGLDVYGVFLELGFGGEDAARRTAEELGIPLYIAHERDAFEREVCTPFADAFRRARTPNPCVWCNPAIKFRALATYADEIGAAYMATGHYARTGRDAEGRALLLRARTAKDQTYMMYRLSRETVARCIFPLGDAADKEEIRREAREHGLAASDKPDSMDICFIADGNVSGWLESHGAACPPGNFIDPDGNILGRHKGLHCYTVGQRRGLGIAAASRLYVRELRPETNEIVLSPQDVFAEAITVQAMHYLAPEYAEGGAFHADVRVRFSQGSTGAVVFPEEDRTRVVFDKAVRAPTRGQSAVFYNGDIVIGGGFIAAVENTAL